MGTAEERHLDWAKLGEEIRRTRRERGETQASLAEAAGLDRKTISNYETGRTPAPGRIPDGYYAVARVFGWPDGRVEQHLGLVSRKPQTSAPPAELAPVAIELYPAVAAFARACAREGADAALRDAFEEAAELLLRSIPAERPERQRDYGLVAYRPHGWGEGDPGMPEDDAERIQRRLAEYVRERNDTP
ncbi:helix-turn-helix domain-containing protein [Kitasatospora sp. NPDC050543]|uniref:helix-turn-helix domain-containing protein n=1 Tax=Kitasatospora sp. NPDC050543 TaxID=3364054 RepID=UPI003797AFD4